MQYDSENNYVRTLPTYMSIVNVAMKIVLSARVG